jgi:hypothetical protein
VPIIAGHGWQFIADVADGNFFWLATLEER